MSEKLRRVTPLINSKGVFEVRKPFRLGVKRIYEVIAIREFPDLHAEHIDIFKAFYEPEGLTVEDYERDVELGVAIISLKGDEGIFYIPDTYIISYPELGATNYYHTVVSLSLGPVHKDFNLAALKKDLNDVVKGIVGVDAEIKLHVSPVQNILSKKEAETIEKVRRGYRTTPDSYNLKLLEEQNRGNKLRRYINSTLKKIVGKKVVGRQG